MAEATLEDLLARRRAVEQRQEDLVRRIQDGDMTVEYDLSEAKAALERLDKQITRARGHRGGIRYVRFRFSRGY